MTTTTTRTAPPEDRPYRDDDGLWLPLPDTARWDRQEGAYVVEGSPVFVCGSHYLADDTGDDDGPDVLDLSTRRPLPPSVWDAITEAASGLLAEPAPF